MLFWGVNRCDGSIVTKSARDVHVENFVMRRGNFYLEPIHWLQYLFLYCFFYLKKCKFVRNRKKCNSDKYLAPFTVHHDLLTLTEEGTSTLLQPSPAHHSLSARFLCGTTTYARHSRFSRLCPRLAESYPHPPVDNLSTDFCELSTGYPQFRA